jgi:hypothetical protein
VLLSQLPVVSAITRWFFAASRRNYAEQLVINTFTTGVSLAVFACLFPLFLAMGPSWFAVAWNSSVLLLSVYYVFVLVKVLGTSAGQLKVVLRAIAAVVLYYFLVSIAIVIPAGVYIYRNGLLTT